MRSTCRNYKPAAILASAIVIFLTSALAEALPPRRVRGSRPVPPCERILANQQTQDEVSALALTVAEWRAEIESLNMMELAPRIAELGELVTAARQAFKVSEIAAEEALSTLRSAVEIETGPGGLSGKIYAKKYPSAPANPDVELSPVRPLFEDPMRGQIPWVQWPPNSDEKP